MLTAPASLESVALVNPEFIARAPHGMEWLAAAELEAAGARVSRLEHRALWVRFAQLPSRAALAGLRTLDDVFIAMGDVPELPRDRSALALLRGLRLDLDAAAAAARHFELTDTRKFTVVASALGKRNYGRYELESALGSALARGRWTFEDSRLGHAGSERLSVRLHVDTGAFVALRVFRHPLHRRAYRSDTSVAALKPPVAAGLCLLADARAGERLHDPFCGVGTIPIEAALAGASVVASGSDISPEQIESARQNAGRAGCSLDLRVASCDRLPFESQSIDAIASNPPWDQKVELARGADDRHWLSEVTRVLGDGGRLVLVVADPDGVRAAAAELGWVEQVRFQMSLFGSHPTVLGMMRSDRREPFFRADTPLSRSMGERYAGRLQPAARS